MEHPPSGLIAFLFTDVEGSSRLWERDEQRTDVLLRRHDEVLRTCVAVHQGYVFSTGGDSFGAAFDTARAAVDAAVEGQRQLGSLGLSVRMGIHAGEAHERDGNYYGPTLNRTARLMAAAHGGQLLVSGTVAELLDDHVALRDLGLHRLRDIPAPFKVWQVAAPGLDRVFPPLGSLDSPRTNLRLPRTPLIGRHDDLQALLTALKGAGLLTIVGAGGMGKTRIALEAAAGALPDFPGGVWLAELAAVDDPARVADVVLAAVGGRLQGGALALETLAELATARQFLVVLDNCEHVLTAAAECAEAIAGSGGSVALATSREPLCVPGEQIFPLSALDEASSIALFVDRARAVDPTFEVAADESGQLPGLCRRLDGMPLAIELAAARVRSMTVSEIAERLRDRFRLLRSASPGGDERHRALRAAVQWSYELLDDRHQPLFDRLSVFAGGFAADAVVAVCTDVEGIADSLDAAEGLDVLVRRSMLMADRRRGTTRYSLLESVRQLGEEQLAAAGLTDEVRGRHAQHYLLVAEALRAELSTPDAAAATRSFEAEWDNFRLASEWYARRMDIERSLRLVVGLYWYAGLVSRYELLPWARTAIALRGASGHALWPAAAGVTAMLEWGVGNTLRAEELANEALRIESERGGARRFEPAFGRLLAMRYLGRAREFQRLLPEAAAIAAQQRDPIELGVINAYELLPYIVDNNQDAHVVEQGTRLAEQHVAEAEASGCPHQLAFAYLGLVACASIAGDKRLAMEAFERAQAWAQLVLNRRVLDNSPLWVAGSLLDDEPLEALALIRGPLVSFHEAGYWGIFGLALVVLLAPLIQTGRPRVAALVLGGLGRQEAGRVQAVPDGDELVRLAEAELRRQLGGDLDQIASRGFSMTSSELARLLIDEIDELLAPAEQAEGSKPTEASPAV